MMQQKDWKNAMDPARQGMQPATRQEKQEEEEQTERDRLEKEYILETGSVPRTKGRHAIHCLTVIGQIEGHVAASPSQKATRYEHVIPQLVSVQEDPEIEGLLILLNTVGGDVEAGLAIAELIAGVSKPTASLVLGGGHSIGIPLAVSARRSFIVPTATMTVHPVRHSGMVVGVPQTMSYFERMQQRITGFVAGHSRISPERFTELMMNTGEMVEMGCRLGAGRGDGGRGGADRRAGLAGQRAALALPGDRAGAGQNTRSRVGKNSAAGAEPACRTRQKAGKEITGGVIGALPHKMRRTGRDPARRFLLPRGGLDPCRGRSESEPESDPGRRRLFAP